MITLYTYLTDKSKVKYLVESEKIHNVKIKYIVGEKWNHYVEKIYVMKEVIKNMKDDEIVSFIDSYDTLINTENLTTKMYETFKKHNKEILFGSELCGYPEKYKTKMDAMQNPCQTNHVYLNAGGYIGYVRALKEMYHWKSEPEIVEICNDGGDQSYYIEYMLAHPEKVGLDNCAEIFLNMHAVEWKQIEINKEGKLVNKELKNIPCIVHFNGGSWQTEKRENILSVIIEKKRAKQEGGNLENYEQIKTVVCKRQLPPPPPPPSSPSSSSLHTPEQITWNTLGLDCHVFYINLKRREDRKKEMEEQLKKYGIPAERFEAIDRPEPTKGIVGCTQSHMEVLKLAKKRNYQNVFILEDDFEFNVEPAKLMKQLYQLKSNNIRFDVCMLGYKLEKGEDTKYEFLKRAYKTQSASAYLIRREFYQKIIDLYEWAIPMLESTGEHWNYANDQVWNRLKPEALWYCIHPRVGKQRDGYSDNSEIYTIYDC